MYSSKLKDKLYSMSVSELKKEINNQPNNYIRTIAIQKIINYKVNEQKILENKIKEKKKKELEKQKLLLLKKQEKNRKKIKKKEELNEIIKAEDFLEDILTIDDLQLDNNDNNENNNKTNRQLIYDKLLEEEVKKDLINNRVMDRLNSNIHIAKNKKNKQLESPYLD